MKFCFKKLFFIYNIFLEKELYNINKIYYIKFNIIEKFLPKIYIYNFIKLFFIFVNPFLYA
jgi:hypothetical protein